METTQRGTFDAFSKDSLIQPNSVTNAVYHYTAIQENVLTCIVGAIQDHMTKENPIQTDLFGQPVVRIKMSQVGSNKTKILEELTKLRKKDIYYSYEDKEGLKKVETGLISGYSDVVYSDYIDLHLSVYSIPYLIYWGSKGFTKFSRTLALTLKGKYTKRIYKMLKQWENNDGGMPQIDIYDWMEKLQMPKSYAKKGHMIKYVLNPAKKELDRHGDITFEYSFQKVKSRSYNKLNIKIFSVKANKDAENIGHWGKFVYFFVGRTYPTHKSDRAREITDQLSDEGNLRSAYEKFSRLDDEFSQGKKNHKDLVLLTQHILKEDFGIQTKGQNVKAAD